MDGEPKEGWRTGKRIEAPKIYLSAMPVEGTGEYLIRMLIMSKGLGDLILDMPPKIIKGAYDKCLQREKEGLKPCER